MLPGHERETRPSHWPAIASIVADAERTFDDGWIFERKLDGVRAISIDLGENIDAGLATLTTKVTNALSKVKA